MGICMGVLNESQGQRLINGLVKSEPEKLLIYHGCGNILDGNIEIINHSRKSKYIQPGESTHLSRTLTLAVAFGHMVCCTQYLIPSQRP